MSADVKAINSKTTEFSRETLYEIANNEDIKKILLLFEYNEDGDVQIAFPNAVTTVDLCYFRAILDFEIQSRLDLR